jgi:soluble lytic murein transglycosylase-like protein
MSRRSVPLALKAAVAEALDPALVCALIEQESDWNPLTMRFQRGVFPRIAVPLLKLNKISITEAYGRCFLWGLMGVLGDDARKAGFTASFLSALCDPGQNLAIGCKILRKKIDIAGGDTFRALLTWGEFQSRERAARYADRTLACRSFWAERLSRKEQPQGGDGGSAVGMR